MQFDFLDTLLAIAVIFILLVGFYLFCGALVLWAVALVLSLPGG